MTPLPGGLGEPVPPTAVSDGFSGFLCTAAKPDCQLTVVVRSAGQDAYRTAGGCGFDP
ncbi:MAG: hypothetical protein LBD24_04720 [Spirochaetaceae bacterium]|nr:hypothetical protein [Spirochaetaceae bacterium]